MQAEATHKTAMSAAGRVRLGRSGNVMEGGGRMDGRKGTVVALLCGMAGAAVVAVAHALGG